MKAFTQNQLRDYSALFSRSEVYAWQKSNFYSIDQKIIRYDQKWFVEKNNTYKDYLKYVYGILETNYINEYIVKNSFLTEWLLPELKGNTATIFNEFRVGKSVADLAIFNGRSKVFEIKTEFDSDHRLQSQLENYHKIFNETFLIIPESRLNYYRKYSNSVGLISYNFKKQKKFEIERPCEVNYDLNSSIVMDTLHTEEYKSIVSEYYGELPSMTSFNQFEISKELILNIPIKILNNLFIEQIKKRKMSEVLSTRYFKEFNQLSLALKLNKQEKQDILRKLNTRLTK